MGEAAALGHLRTFSAAPNSLLQMSEFQNADKMVEGFLGIKWGHLCPQFGFHHNVQHWLVCQALTSFLAFHALLLAVRCAWARFQRPQQGRGAELLVERDPTIEELERFSTMIDRTLTTMTQAETESMMASQQSVGSSDTRQERPQDLQRLKDDFQRKINAMKAKWKSNPDGSPAAGAEEPDGGNVFHVTALLIVIYWVAQASLSCFVMCSIGISMLSIADRGVWAHYCLLIYAVSNSGILPTGCQAAAFLADWLSFEALTSMPPSGAAPTDPSYQAIVAPGASAGCAQAVQKRQEEVAQMKAKFVLLCLPELVPLFFMLVTHTIPFMFSFLWLTLLIMVVTYLLVLLVQAGVRRLAATPSSRVVLQAQVLAFAFQMLTTTYVHVSVQVMTRVYAGEWRHGGYFDSLWLHLIIDADKLAACGWLSAVRIVDLPLRWL